MNPTQDDARRGNWRLETAEKIFASFSCNDLHLFGKKQPLIIEK